jgi:hypothetical protein
MEEEYFKVSCEYYIKATDKEEAEEIVINDLSSCNFFEEHLIVEYTDKETAEKEGLFN